MAAILVNNSVWRAETQHNINAVNGRNHDGTVVWIRNKRTGQEISIPLPVWVQFEAALRLHIKLP
jgi:hypothetical protein